MNLPKEIDYPCSNCGKSFKVPYEKADTNDEIITCPYCGSQEKIAHEIVIKGTTKNLTEEFKKLNKKKE